MKYGSVFTGIGGFDLGFDRAEMTCTWQSEIDKDASKVLKNHWPNVKNIGDVRNVKRDTVEPVDVICGGFPCQDLSVAGKRAGLAGERSGLWFEFARVIDELEPRWVVIENVPGLLSSHNGKDFAVILRWLAERGYGVAWRVLDAQYFGVPQRRRRVFVVGSLGDGRCAEVLFEREGVPGNIAPSREAGKDVAYSIASNATGRKPENGPQRGDFSVGVSHSLDIVAPHAVAWNWQSGGDVRHDVNEKPMLQASQIPAVGVRRLTPVECERLQGFPDGWTAGQADTVRYRQLGNAVAVPVIEWIGRRIAR